MDLEVYIKDFINDNLSIEEMIKITNFSFFRIIRIIENYYKLAKSDMPKYIKEKINDIYLDMYEMRKRGLSYSKIAEKYNCSGEAAKKYIEIYCINNNMEVLDNINVKKDVSSNKNIGNKKSRLLEDIYNYKLSGMTYEKIAQIYDCSNTRIRMLLVEYCKNNKLKIPNSYKIKVYKKEISLTPKEIYDLRVNEKSYYSIALRCNCSTTKIKNVLTNYCKEKNLEIPDINNKYFVKKVNLPMDEIYKLKSKGMSYKKLALKYNCSTYSIAKKLNLYLQERLLTDFYLMLDDKKDKIYKDDENNIKSLV